MIVTEPTCYITILLQLNASISPHMEIANQLIQEIEQSPPKETCDQSIQCAIARRNTITLLINQGIKNTNSILNYIHKLVQDIIYHANSTFLLPTPKITTANIIGSICNSYNKIRKLWYEFSLFRLQIENDLTPHLKTLLKISNLKNILLECRLISGQINALHEEINRSFGNSVILPQESHQTHNHLKIDSEIQRLTEQTECFSTKVEILKPKMNNHLQMLTANIQFPIGNPSRLKEILLSKAIKKPFSFPNTSSPHSLTNHIYFPPSSVLCNDEQAFIATVDQLQAKIREENDSLRYTLVTIWNALSIEMYKAKNRLMIISDLAKLQPQLKAIIEDQKLIDSQLRVMRTSQEIGSLQQQVTSLNKSTAELCNPEESIPLSLDALYTEFQRKYSQIQFQSPELIHIDEAFHQAISKAETNLIEFKEDACREIDILYDVYKQRNKELASASKSEEGLRRYVDPEFEDNELASSCGSPVTSSLANQESDALETSDAASKDTLTLAIKFQNYF